MDCPWWRDGGRQNNLSLFGPVRMSQGPGGLSVLSSQLSESLASSVHGPLDHQLWRNPLLLLRTVCPGLQVPSSLLGRPYAHFCLLQPRSAPAWPPPASPAAVHTCSGSNPAQAHPSAPALEEGQALSPPGFRALVQTRGLQGCTLLTRRLPSGMPIGPGADAGPNRPADC